LVVLSHGSGDMRMRQLCRVVPLLEALGLARRDRRIVPLLISMIAWLK